MSREQLWKWHHCRKTRTRTDYGSSQSRFSLLKLFIVVSRANRNDELMNFREAGTVMQRALQRCPSALTRAREIQRTKTQFVYPAVHILSRPARRILLVQHSLAGFLVMGGEVNWASIVFGTTQSAAQEESGFGERFKAGISFNERAEKWCTPRRTGPAGHTRTGLVFFLRVQKRLKGLWLRPAELNRSSETAGLHRASKVNKVTCLFFRG